MTAVDFAWSPPPISVLQQYGVTAVGRYVGPASWGKTITQAEFDSYVAAGIAVWLVFEAGGDDAMGGFNAGMYNARLALANVPVGYDGAIYMACDQDLRGQDLQTGIDYIHGASTVLGPERTGDYGPGALCQATHDQGFAHYHWQSGSTSFNGNGSTLPITQIQQGVGNPIPGYDTDPNTILSADFGQHPSVVPPPPPIPTTQETQMFCTDPDSGGIWETDPSGELFCPDVAPGVKAPFVAGLNQHPDWHAGDAESGGKNPVVGILATKGKGGKWGLAYLTFDWQKAPDGSPFHVYRFNRDGSTD